MISNVKEDDAVSPVIGIMLMLVITVVIAAIVAAVSSGLVTSTEPAPTAIVKCEGYTTNLNYGNIYYDITSMTFVHMGGDSLQINDIRITLNYQHHVTSHDTLSDPNHDGKWTVGEYVTISDYEPYGYGVTDESVAVGRNVEYSIVTKSGDIIADGEITIIA